MLLLSITISFGACVSPSDGPNNATPTELASTPARTPLPTKPSPPGDWLGRWLKGIPCRPPCWEGITPGQTTPIEAVEIWEQSPVITAVKIVTLGITPETGIVTWNWVSSGEKGGEAYFHTQPPSSPIYAIHPYLPPCKLRDVIQAYGDPSHVAATSYYPSDSSDMFYSLSILYLSQGFILFSEGGRSKPILSEDTSLESVIFFAPGIEGLQKASLALAIDLERFAPWQGIKDFDFYCRDMKGRPCSQEPASK